MAAKSLIAKLEVPATDALIAAKAVKFETSTIESMCTIYDESKTSALMLILPDLYDSCPGGEKSDKRIGCAEILKFVASTEKQIELTILAN